VVCELVSAVFLQASFPEVLILVVIFGIFDCFCIVFERCFDECCFIRFFGFDLWCRFLCFLKT
jgi:hypothetical protein